MALKGDPGLDRDPATGAEGPLRTAVGQVAADEDAGVGATAEQATDEDPFMRLVGGLAPHADALARAEGFSVAGFP